MLRANAKTNRVVRAGAAALAAAALAGCGLTGPAKTEFEATLTAAEGVNPTPDGSPAPVAVRLYELKSKAAFESASFFDLFERDLGALGPDLIERHEFVLAPGGEETFAAELSPDAAFIGVLVAYRDIDTAQWRETIEVEKGEETKAVIEVDQSNVRVQLD